MGYALFANRKLMYTNMVYSLQSKLDQIMQEKQNLLNFSANIADGIVTAQENAEDISNFSNYCIYENEFAQFISTPDEEGGAATSIGNYISSLPDTLTEAEKTNYALTVQNAARTKFAQNYNKRLEAMENQLDQQQKKIETQLSVAQSQLQAVEEAEGQAIEKATPKYNGVG